ncbi:uncharacterized protein [Antedon mediterranea]
MMESDDSDDYTVILGNLETTVKKVLPNIKERKLHQILKRLKELGAETPDDLHIVQDDDLLGTCSTIEIRKLTTSWKKGDSTETQCQSPEQPKKMSRVSSWVSSLSSPNSSLSSNRSLEICETKYDIPWHKFSPKLMEALENKVRPQPTLRREMIRIIVDNLNQPDVPLPRKKTLSFIAEKIVAKYPDSFIDRINGTVVGSGHESLLTQLVCKVDNIKRPCELKRKRTALTDTTPKTTDTYGCINFMPLDYPEGQTDKTQNEIKTNMQDTYKTSSAAQSNDIQKSMHLTFVSQRHSINKKDFVLADFLTDWPYITKEINMSQHFEQLTGVNITNMLTDAFSTKVPKLLRYMKSLDVENIQDVMKKIEEAVTRKEDNTPQVLGTIQVISSYFNEPFNSSVMCTETSTSSTSSLQLPDTPCIVAHGSPLEAEQFEITIGQKVVTEVKNPISAVCCWFMSYYCFNFEYGENAGVMEFIQRCFVGINPCIGSKRMKKKKGKSVPIHPKVIALTNKLMDFENEWSLTSNSQ